MAEIKTQGLRSIIAGMMTEQMQQQKRDLPKGVVGGIWEGVTGEIKKYNKVAEENIKLETERRARIAAITAAQDKLRRINREVEEGLRNLNDAADTTTEEIADLKKEIVDLHKENEKTAESLHESRQALEDLGKQGGIIKSGLTALALKVGGAAAAFFSWREALGAVDNSLRFSAKTLSHTAAATGNYTVSVGDAIGKTMDWSGAITSTTWSMAKMGIGAEDTRKIMGSMADGLRITTESGDELLGRTQQMTEDIGLMSRLLRVNTDELASATVDASKRFGKSTDTMADDMAGMFDAIQRVKLGSKDTVVSFSDLSRATLDAQASFQGYNFNLKSTATILGNVVAKAQEQGATYDMAMKAAKGLAGVITGGKAPDWAKYMAGKELRNEVVGVVKAAKQANKELNVSGEDAAKNIADALRKSFGAELSDQQVKGLQRLSENWREYGELSSAKMTEELLRGTEKGNEQMFKRMKKMADKPEGRELLMRVWGLDEAAATAATLAMTTAEGMKDFMKIKEEAQAATKERKPPSIKDLRDQTGEYVAAMGAMHDGLGNYLMQILGVLKTNPLAMGAVGAVGLGTTFGIEAIQSGIAKAVVSAVGSSRFGQAMGTALNKTVGAGLAVAKAPFRLAGAAARGIGTGAGWAGDLLGRGAGRLGTAARGVGDVLGRGAGRFGMAARGAGEFIAQRAGAIGAAAQRGAGAIGRGATRAAGRIGDVMTVAMQKQSVAMKGLTKVTGKVSAGFGAMRSGIGKLAGTAAGKAGLVGLAGAAGYAVGSLIRMIPGVDSFTEGLIDSTAKLLGFKGAVSDATAAQDALANKSPGIAKALEQVAVGITTDYERQSFKHMVAVRQLKGLTDDDLRGYAKQLERRTGLDEEDAMRRLKRLREEKVDDERFRELQRVALGRREKAEKAVRAGRAPAVTPTVALKAPTQLAAAAGMVAPEMLGLGGPAFEQMSKQSMGVWGRAGAAVEERLSMPVAMPPAARQGRGGRTGGRIAEALRQQGVTVHPDGSIRIDVMIPRDALDRSNFLTTGQTR